MALASYAIPNLAQGISQQPDAQRDPSQGEVQINGMSSILEGLRKRDCSESVALVSSSNFGDAFIHSILRDNVEEYLAVITSTGIQVFDLDGVAQTVNAPGGYGYLSSVTDARANIRAVTIADYTFISNTKTSPAMNTATAPATARPPRRSRCSTRGRTASAPCSGKSKTVSKTRNCERQAAGRYRLSRPPWHSAMRNGVLVR